MSFDVAVVGSGIVGGCIAWRFAQRGLRVGLFDRCPPNLTNGPASPAAGGILSAQVEGEGGGPLFELLRESERAHARLAEELGSEAIGYLTRGVLRVAADEAHLALLKEEQRWQRDLGLRVEALDGPALRKLEPALSPALLEGSFFPDAAQVDARKLLATVLEHCQRRGVVRRFSAAVEGVTVEAGRVRGIAAGGDQVDAGIVVVAAGAWSSQLQGVGFAPDAVFPVRGQMLELTAPSPALTRVVFGEGGYLVPRAGLQGDRVLVGSTMERVGFEGGVTAQAQQLLKRRAAQLCPALEGAAPTNAWFGFRPATADGLPAIGPTPIAGLHLAVGFLRNGILLAPRAAELVVGAALGEGDAIPSAFNAARLLC